MAIKWEKQKQRMSSDPEYAERVKSTRRKSILKHRSQRSEYSKLWARKKSEEKKKDTVKYAKSWYRYNRAKRPIKNRSFLPKKRKMDSAAQYWDKNYERIFESPLYEYYYNITFKQIGEYDKSRASNPDPLHILLKEERDRENQKRLLFYFSPEEIEEMLCAMDEAVNRSNFFFALSAPLRLKLLKMGVK